MCKPFRILISLCLLSATAFAGLKDARVTVAAVDDAPAARTKTGLAYQSFLEATAFWDTEAANRIGKGDDQKRYVKAMQALSGGDEATAETLLREVRAKSSDEILANLATSLLE